VTPIFTSSSEVRSAKARLARELTEHEGDGPAKRVLNPVPKVIRVKELMHPMRARPDLMSLARGRRSPKLATLASEFVEEEGVGPLKRLAKGCEIVLVGTSKVAETALR
jgi:hypothetical protein